MLEIMQTQNEALREIMQKKRDPPEPKKRFYKMDFVTFDGSKSKYKAFIRCFEHAFKYNELPEDCKGQFLISQLRGKAQEAVNPIVDKNPSYATVRKTLDLLFDRPKSATISIMEMENLDRAAYTDAADYAYELTKAVKEALPGLSEEDLDAYVKTKFMLGLPLDKQARFDVTLYKDTTALVQAVMQSEMLEEANKKKNVDAKATVSSTETVEKPKPGAVKPTNTEAKATTVNSVEASRSNPSAEILKDLKKELVKVAEGLKDMKAQQAASAANSKQSNWTPRSPGRSDYRSPYPYRQESPGRSPFRPRGDSGYRSPGRYDSDNRGYSRSYGGEYSNPYGSDDRNRSYNRGRSGYGQGTPNRSPN
jgi:hypothetical protein